MRVRRFFRTAGALLTAACFLLILLWPLAGGWDETAVLEVWFLDVGQGDAALVRCGDEAMLVDGGPITASGKIFTFLRNTLQLTHLRCIVASHPHDDHIGGLSAALNALQTDLLLTPVLHYDSKPFADMMKYAEAQGTQIMQARDGDSFSLGGATVTVVSAWQDAPSVNDQSVFLRVDWGEVSVLFTGDAEYPAEYSAIDIGAELRCTVLKVAHHGSDTSTTDEFVRAASPQWAVISCAADNPYGHPMQPVLDSLAKGHVQLHRTDLEGDIHLISDGRSLIWETEREADPALLAIAPRTAAQDRALPEAVYIGNRNSQRFHYPDCASVVDMKPANQVLFQSREEAIEAGYTPCGRCKP